MDTQNDGLEEVTPFKKWQFLVSMLDFLVCSFQKSTGEDFFDQESWVGKPPKDRLCETSLGRHHPDHRHRPFASSPSDPTTIDTTCGTTTEHADFIVFSNLFTFGEGVS